MKRVKVTVTAELELPDDFEIGTTPEEWPCLKRGTSYYRPTIDWEQRVPGSGLEKSGGLGFMQPDEDTDLLLNEAAYSEDSQIEPVDPA